MFFRKESSVGLADLARLFRAGSLAVQIPGAYSNHLIWFRKSRPNAILVSPGFTLYRRMLAMKTKRFSVEKIVGVKKSAEVSVKSGELILTCCRCLANLSA
jgi:hypothetical protein